MKKICQTLLPIYLLCVLYLTLLDRTPSQVPRAMLQPFWEWHELFISSRKSYWLEQIGGNLIMLFPLGILLPMISPMFQKSNILILTAFCFSLWIEITQYFTCLGLMEFDDLFHNTVGAAAGFAVWRLCTVKFRKIENIKE